MPRGKEPRSRRGLRGIRRDRDCQNCKSRGVKCDLNRPRCFPCVQSGLACGGYPQRVVWTSTKILVASNSSGERAWDPAPELLDMVHTRPDYDGSPSPARQTQPPPRLLTAEVASKGYPAGHPMDQRAINDHNWFPQRLEALCASWKLTEASSSGEQHTTTASRLLCQVEKVLRLNKEFSATSTAESPSPSSPNPASVAPDTRQPGAGDTFELQCIDALGSLNDVLESANPVAFLGILVLAYFEVLSATAFGQWQIHLQGARALLDHHCRNRKDAELFWHAEAHLPEMISYFIWWDVAGVVIRHLSGSQAELEERLIFLDWHRALIGVDFFATVGCPPECFQLFVSLAKVSDILQRAGENESLGDEKGRYVLAMEQLLQLGLVANDQGMCEDTWRCAAAIALLTWDGQDDTKPMVELRQRALTSAVDRICRAISSVPPTSRFYAHMAKPAFLAGINATSPGQCEVMREYWRNCQSGGVPRHLGALTQCEERWRKLG